MILPVLLLSTLVLAQDVPEPEMAPAPPPEVAATEARPDAAAVEIDLGLKAFRRRAFARAEEHFQKAVDADPESAAANYYLGYAIYKKVELRPFHPDKQRAAKFFSTAFTLDPTFRPEWGRGH
jgi:Tfp pilus assembly protein PilF